MFQPVIAGLSGVLAAFDAGEDAARSRDDVSAIELEKTAAQRHEGALERGKRRGLAQGRLQLAGGGEVVEPELAQPRLAVEGGADAVALARRLEAVGVVCDGDDDRCGGGQRKQECAAQRRKRAPEHPRGGISVAELRGQRRMHQRFQTSPFRQSGTGTLTSRCQKADGRRKN